MSPEPHGRSAAENGRARSAAWVDAVGPPAGHTEWVLTAKVVRGYGFSGAQRRYRSASAGVLRRRYAGVGRGAPGEHGREAAAKAHGRGLDCAPRVWMCGAGPLRRGSRSSASTRCQST
jgi:hypothetical protein